MEKKKSFAESVSEKIIDQLEKGTAPWQKPWKPGDPGNLPMNPISGKRYKGINTLNLMMESTIRGYNDPRWLTYNQAQDLGGQVKKGEKSSLVQYWKFTDKIDKLDSDGKPVLDEEGKKVKIEVKLDKPKVFYAYVFNAEQVDNMPPLPPVEKFVWNPIERVEAILKNSEAKIFNDQKNAAFYSVIKDSIHLPPKEQFESPDKYYATALHELAHWTGSHSRLDRDLSHPFGSEGYAREELRAEISSMIMGEELNIGHDPGQHVAYVGSWIKALKEEPFEIFRAAADAEKIQGYVFSFELEQKKDLTREEEVMPRPETLTQDKSIDKRREENTILYIPYAQKETVREIAGKLPDGSSAIEWNNQEKVWFAKPGADLEKLKPWLVAGKGEKETNPISIAKEKTILAIPYQQKDTVKSLAGKLSDGSSAIEWDKQEKVWIAKPGANLEKLKPWLPENQNVFQETKLTPREEFAEELKSIGCIVSGEHPIMDGKNHRIAVVGDKKGETAGFYKSFLDGHPAGYMKNNRTGVEMKWKSKGYHLSEEEKAKLNAEAAIKQEERRKKQELEYESAALKAQEQFSKLKPVDEGSTPYLIKKGVDVYPGISVDTKNNMTYIPAYDVDGKQWSSQYIKEDGQKGFTKGSKKQGCFHVVGGLEALKNAPVLIISEGYATAASVTKVVGYSTIAAFDAGNLKSVATSLHEKYPDKPIIIAGDDDRKLEETQKINPGKTKAIEAAAAVNGKAIFPVFAPGEGRKLTDFNDLAVKSTLGQEAIVRQIKAAISLNVNKTEQLNKVTRQKSVTKQNNKQSLKIQLKTQSR